MLALIKWHIEGECDVFVISPHSGSRRAPYTMNWSFGRAKQAVGTLGHLQVLARLVLESQLERMGLFSGWAGQFNGESHPVPAKQAQPRLTRAEMA